MIAQVYVHQLRGIGNGTLSELAPLTVLTGPNGSGKSTILEALLVGCSSSPAHTVGDIVRRRQGTMQGAEFLFTYNGSAAQIDVTPWRGQGARTELRLVPEAEVVIRNSLVELRAPHSKVEVRRNLSEGEVLFGYDNEFRAAFSHMPGDGAPVDFVRLIDPSRDLDRSLVDVYSAVYKAGRKPQVVHALRAVVGEDFRDVAIMTAGERPYLAVELARGALPLGVLGDGIHSLSRLMLELANIPDGGLALLEEPEIHAHGRTLSQFAKMAWATVQRGVQVVLTTHSLELVDALVAEAPPERLGEDLVAFRLRLEDGFVRPFRVGGNEIALLRADFAEDLR